MIFYDDPPVARNPYHYIRDCLLGKWKLTLLHHIHNYGSIRFIQTLQVLPISEKVLSQQLRELCEYGIIKRVAYDAIPPKVEYFLTESGEELIDIIDNLFIWSIKEMKKNDIDIDPDAFVVHNKEKYIVALDDIIDFDYYLNKAENAKKIDEKIKSKKMKPNLNKWQSKP